MSTSLVHVLKLIGPRAREGAAECERLRALRRPTVPRGLSSEDWSSAAHGGIDAFAEGLLRLRGELPVVYQAQYLDTWSVAGSSLSSVTGRAYAGRLCSDTWNVWFHALPDRGWLARRVARGRKLAGYRTASESRWLLDHVDEAARYAAVFSRPALVVALIQTIGGSRGDDEYRRCLMDVRRGP